MPFPHDRRTRCHRCDSPNWCSIGVCEDCEQDCCTDCASPELEGLVCSQCALIRVLEAEVGVGANELAVEYKLVEPMQGVLFEEWAKKPARVQVSPIYREEVA